MGPTEERAAFGRRLRELRKNHDETLDSLATKLTADGHPYTGANIGAWERGEYAPRTRATVLALEELLDGQGQLAPLLGLASPRLSSAAGTDLDELKELDPDGYEDVMALLDSRLDRARRRSG